MKHLKYLFVISFFSMASCCDSKCKKQDLAKDTTQLKVVGGDADQHGCKASAGYQWSELKNDCIRPFELPVKILSVDSTTQTGLIFSEDRIQAEVFSPSGHFMMKKKMEFQYESADKNSPAKLYRNSNGEWVFEAK